MNSKTITRAQLCAMFDHTNLKPHASQEDFRALCSEAAENHFAMVAINSAPVALCKGLLAGTGVHVGAAISFPLGQTTLETKLFETRNAIEHGADEIDYVINIGELKAGNWGYIRDEMQQIVDLCREHNVLSKVIFENCYLSQEEIASLARIAKDIRPDFIKTSTGFGSYGARVQDVELMASAVEGACQVKAAGGIRDWETCAAMIDAGATRIGTSASFVILAGFDRERE